MNLSLRAKLRLPEACSDAELQDACSRYYTIYTGVLETAKQESVKAIARSKLEDLLNSAREEQIPLKAADICDWGSYRVDTNASVEMELAKLSPTGMIAASKAKQLESMISALPESAKRNYLSALVILRSGESSIETYNKALDKLKEARVNDPDNPVYEAMIDDIETDIGRYSTELSAWRAEREHEITVARRKAVASEVFSTAGTVLLWVAGAVVTVAAAVLGCVCSIFESC